jgi:hypothetical protein
VTLSVMGAVALQACQEHPWGIPMMLHSYHIVLKQLPVSRVNAPKLRPSYSEIASVTFSRKCSSVTLWHGCTCAADLSTAP